jgi:hypothetical protein
MGTKSRLISTKHSDVQPISDRDANEDRLRKPEKRVIAEQVAKNEQSQNCAQPDSNYVQSHLPEN